MTSVRGTLYVVASPLGNLEDLTARARRVLSEVDLVAAEDTRRARKLLQHVGASPRTLSFHAHSPPARLKELERALGDGAAIALLTDAGTPTVSDPGEVLVARARAAGAEVVPVPGPSAITTALSVSGLPANRYTFLGFAPRRGAARRELLDQVRSSPWTVVLFESPHRLKDLLLHLAEVCGSDRHTVVGRELTKIHEEVKVGTLNDLAVYYGEHPPRGEVTVMVAGSPLPPSTPDAKDLERRARELLDSGLSRRDTAARLAEEFDLPRKDAYRTVNAL